MKQVFQNPKSGKLRVEEIPMPTARPGGVLVENKISVISAGTEKSIIELSRKNLLKKAQERPDYVQKFISMVKTRGIVVAWRTAQLKLSTDISLGYSSAGKVIKVGAGVEEFRVGDRVACAGQNYASHAQKIFVPKNLCAKIPKNVSDEEASFSTLGAIAMHGIRQANLRVGETVAVIGLGLLGQIATRILHAYGHPVIGLDINESQIKFAKENGLDEGVLIGRDNEVERVKKFTSSKGVDAVIIYASSKSSEPLTLAVNISRDKGRVVQVGSVLSNIPWRDFYQKELTFISSRSYGPGRYDKEYEEKGNDYPYPYVRWTEKRNLEEFLRLISEKKIVIRNLITKVFPISEAEKAYEFIFKNKGVVHGVLLSYKESEEKDSSVFNLPFKETNPLEGEIRIGLVGTGSFMRSTIIPYIRKMQDVQVVGVCDSDGLVSKKIAEEFSARYSTTDYKKIIQDKNIDVIICATRHSSHAQIVKEAIIEGKHVFVEKPLALNEKDLVDLATLAYKSGKILSVGFNRRFSPHIEIAKKEFTKSEMPVSIMYRVNAGPLEDGHWILELDEGGRIIGEGCHFIDTISAISGSSPKRVTAMGIPVEGKTKHDENFTIVIEFENGSVGTIFYTALGNFGFPKEYIEIYGAGKIMTIEDFKKASVIENGKKTKQFKIRQQDKGYMKEFSLFFESLKSGGAPPISVEELFNTHIATIRALKSLKTGKTFEL